MRGVGFELANQRGLPLRGDVFLPDEPSGSWPVVVVCHGFKGFKNWGFFPHLGQRLAEAGFACVLFNFSGSGVGSDLQNFTELDLFAADTVSQQVDDLGDVLDGLEAGSIAVPGADLTRIGVLGHSRGAATALIRAAEDSRVRVLVTWAGVSRLVRASDRELEAWKQQGYMEFLNARTKQLMRVNYSLVQDVHENGERFDLPRRIASLRIPVLLVHGAEDLSVRVDEARELNAAVDPARSELCIVPRTGHTFGAVHPWEGTTTALDTAIEHTARWFARHLNPEGSRST